jgi:hypothetical protein
MTVRRRTPLATRPGIAARTPGPAGGAARQQRPDEAAVVRPVAEAGRRRQLPRNGHRPGELTAASADPAKERR